MHASTIGSGHQIRYEWDPHAQMLPPPSAPAIIGRSTAAHTRLGDLVQSSSHASIFKQLSPIIDERGGTKPAETKQQQTLLTLVMLVATVKNSSNGHY
jgi:hypothetical protein